MNSMNVSSYKCGGTTRFSFQPRLLYHRHRSSSVSSHAGQKIVTVASANPTNLNFDMTKEKIRKLFKNVELSISSYDTAWVAMVPSPNTPNSPCFPQCLNWLIDNQLNDGSWGLHHHHHHPTLLKDNLSSTLACVLALKRWNVGEEQINKGLSFLGSNFASASDENQHSPIGFDIIFPSMLEYAKDLNLEVPLRQEDLSVMLHERELELRRCHSHEKKAYLAYISEGLGNFHDHDMVMKYQMKNGSIFNSPSATAAALVHHHNVGCLNYLSSLLKKFGNAVPSIYPVDIYARLCMVDTLTSLGIARHFKEEIQNVLDETYRCWVEADEEIFMDVGTCALAFRILRFNGYEISSDRLAEITKEGAFMNSFKEPFRDVYTAVEVYKSSQISMHQEELAFGDLNLRSRNILERKSSNTLIPEVHDVLEFPLNCCLERISTRRNIEHYNVENTRTLKTTFGSLNISSKDYKKLAVEDFNACQTIYRDELKDLENWVTEMRLDQLKFARQRTAYCYFCATTILPSPELYDGRIAWAKSTILTGAIDDFFDVGASMDEIENLIQCVKKWNIDVDKDCCSEIVRIVFLALKDAVTWIGDRAFKHQSRSITTHLIQTWLDLMKSMLKEAEWTEDNSVPTMSEYTENGIVSFALAPIVFATLYIIEPNLSEEVVQSSEMNNLLRLMSIQGRLLNDIQTYKRELEAGKLNAVTLSTRDGDEEEVVKEIKMIVNDNRKELMRLVLEVNGSIVPRSGKDIFWGMSNMIHLFYTKDDGFSRSDLLKIVKEIIYEPLSMSMNLKKIDNNALKFIIDS